MMPWIRGFIFIDQHFEYCEEPFQKEIYTLESLTEEYYKNPALENQLMAGSLRSFVIPPVDEDLELDEGACTDDPNLYNDLPLLDGVYMLTFLASLYILNKILHGIFIKRRKKKEIIQV